VVELLHSKCKALNSTPTTTKNNKTKKIQKEQKSLKKKKAKEYSKILNFSPNSGNLQQDFSPIMLTKLHKLDDTYNWQAYKATDPHTLLLGVYHGTISVNRNLAVGNKIPYAFILQPKNPALRTLPSSFPIQKLHMYKIINSNIICNCKILETT
jgi:hypothetical protein